MHGFAALLGGDRGGAREEEEKRRLSQALRYVQQTSFARQRLTCQICVIRIAKVFLL
jgi:hypothetical protein